MGYTLADLLAARCADQWRAAGEDLARQDERLAGLIAGLGRHPFFGDEDAEDDYAGLANEGLRRAALANDLLHGLDQAGPALVARGCRTAAHAVDLAMAGETMSPLDALVVGLAATLSEVAALGSLAETPFGALFLKLDPSARADVERELLGATSLAAMKRLATSLELPPDLRGLVLPTPDSDVARIAAEATQREPGEPAPFVDELADLLELDPSELERRPTPPPDDAIRHALEHLVGEGSCRGSSNEQMRPGPPVGRRPAPRPPRPDASSSSVSRASVTPAAPAPITACSTPSPGGWIATTSACRAFRTPPPASTR